MPELTINITGHHYDELRKAAEEIDALGVQWLVEIMVMGVAQSLTIDIVRPTVLAQLKASTEIMKGRKDGGIQGPASP